MIVLYVIRIMVLVLVLLILLRIVGIVYTSWDREMKSALSVG